MPTGDSFESLFSDGFDSAEPTMWYSTVSFADTSRSFTCEPTETTSLATSFLEMTRALANFSSSDRDAVLEQRLVVLGVVVLGVLRDVAELPRDADPLGNLAALVVRQELDLILELLVALRSEDHFLHFSCLLMKNARRIGAVAAEHGTCGVAIRQTPEP